jgi:glycosyltransferase involved in cell wall biosynthesis
VRVLIDYRAALRHRSGVGEYVHQLASALAAGCTDPLVDVTLFSSSWKDRLRVGADLGGVATVDRRVPVALLNFAWHRLEWPPAERFAGRGFDVAHSLHPLLMPTEGAAQVVTVHDLNFLAHPERTSAEIRRDYAALARPHAHRAHAIIVPSMFTRGEVEGRLGVPAERIFVCPPGAPPWNPRRALPADGGYVLFLGTLEPRKNVGALLNAYELALQNGRAMPDLVLAGRATEESAVWLARIARAPLAGRVRHIGYVDPGERRTLYEGARVLVQPSYEEGFGLPVLEAMTIGVPVVAADRGALPEVLGDAGLLVDPDSAACFAAAINRMATDADLAAASTVRGIARARAFRWTETATRVVNAYRYAIDRRVRG